MTSASFSLLREPPMPVDVEPLPATPTTPPIDEMLKWAASLADMGLLKTWTLGEEVLMAFSSAPVLSELRFLGVKLSLTR